jgi:hypothetical protein
METVTTVDSATSASIAQLSPPRPQRLMATLAVVAGVFLVLLCSYIPTVFVGATANIRLGAAIMVGFFAFALVVVGGGIWLAARGRHWREAAGIGLGTKGRSGVRRVMYGVAGSSILAMIYGATLAFNPSGDWRYGIYLIATVLPMLAMATAALLELNRGRLSGKMLARAVVITWPLAFLLFGNFLGLTYGLLIFAVGLWAIHGLRTSPADSSLQSGPVR